jgi:5-formyltetrahydrofolate cyclo-ligase
MTLSKQAIRSAKRQQRRTLTRARQNDAAQRLAAIVSIQPFFLHSQALAFYLANDGELSPDFLMALAQAAGKITCLPVLDRLQADRMHFFPYRDGDRLRPNRFGIPEPDLKLRHKYPAWTLDVVFLPLVAFDRKGNRLGMGGGFYDRTFARYSRAKGNAPLLVGIAHSFQEVDSLPTEPWDIALHAIATEKEFIRISHA